MSSRDNPPPAREVAPAHPLSPRGVGAFDAQCGALFLGGGHLGAGVRLERIPPVPGLDAWVYFVLRFEVAGRGSAFEGDRRCFEVAARVNPAATPGQVLRMLAGMANELAKRPEADQ